MRTARDRAVKSADELSEALARRLRIDAARRGGGAGGRKGVSLFKERQQPVTKEEAAQLELIRGRRSSTTHGTSGPTTTSPTSARTRRCTSCGTPQPVPAAQRRLRHRPVRHRPPRGARRPGQPARALPAVPGVRGRGRHPAPAPMSGTEPRAGGAPRRRRRLPAPLVALRPAVARRRPPRARRGRRPGREGPGRRPAPGGRRGNPQPPRRRCRTTRTGPWSPPADSSTPTSTPCSTGCCAVRTRPATTSRPAGAPCAPQPALRLWHYWASHLDPTGEEVDPLLHFLLVGRQAGLSPLPEPGPTRTPTSYAAGQVVRRGLPVRRLRRRRARRRLRRGLPHRAARHADVFYVADGVSSPASWTGSTASWPGRGASRTAPTTSGPSRCWRATSSAGSGTRATTR